MMLKKIFVYPRYPENLNKLFEIAYNIWWSWDYEALNLFYRIDPFLFRECGHNPIKFLYTLPKEKIEELSHDSGFLYELEKIWKKFEEYKTFRRRFSNSEFDVEKRGPIAYFCMEFGLHESFPIYAGGLGILAGDILKSASDMGIPVIGVGLLYKYGYFTQKIDSTGNQEELFIEFENHYTPVREARDKNGNPVYVEVKILDRMLKAKVWTIDIGITKAILLDADIPDNPEDLRSVTDELYVADRDKRIQQEILLGFGGIKALKALDIHPTIYHLNEGHSAFLIIARLQSLIKEKGFSFSSAMAIIKNSTVFTTHTPVIEGNEHYPVEMIEKYLRKEIESLGISFDQFLSYGICEKKEIFWLPAFAIRFSNFVNAVSIQHREVSKRMWKSLFPNLHISEIPITHVTNGVHTSWISESFTELFNRYLGKEWNRHPEKTEMWENLRKVPEEEIWYAHMKNKRILMDYLKRKLAVQYAEKGFSYITIEKLTRAFNPEYLTITFARRFAPYKRPTLILKDRKRLKKILKNEEKPVQLIFAGKAHPADERGQEMIREIISFINEEDLQERVFFIENYDMSSARHLLWGSDVWLNTPEPEMEASGTSGIKAGMNGVLHLSTLEGWWIEGYNRKNGWAITEGRFHTAPEFRSTAEANQIYRLLEDEVTELYYKRDKNGIPVEWCKMMKESIISICSRFNMNLVLQEYLTKFYLPSWREYERISKDNYKILKEIEEERERVLAFWKSVEIKSVQTGIEGKNHLVEGQKMDVSAVVYFGEAPPKYFSVEVFYLYRGDNKYEIIPMELIELKAGEAYYFTSFFIKEYGPQSINVRIRPSNPIIVSLHPELVKWKD
jgi:starch phosphorylase